MTKEFKGIRLHNDFGPDLLFKGKLLGGGLSEHSTLYSHKTYKVYQCFDGDIVCLKSEADIRELTVTQKIKKVNGGNEALEFLGFCQGAKNMFQGLGIDFVEEVR